jgi:hypothetical protein
LLLHDNFVSFARPPIAAAIKDGSFPFDERLRAIGFEAAEDMAKRDRLQQAAFEPYDWPLIEYMASKKVEYPTVQQLLRDQALNVLRKGFTDKVIVVGWMVFAYEFAIRMCDSDHAALHALLSDNPYEDLQKAHRCRIEALDAAASYVHGLQKRGHVMTMSDIIAALTDLRRRWHQLPDKHQL